MIRSSEKIAQALDIAFQYAQIDGAHHKTWCIDQIVRILTGDGYEDWIKTYNGAYDEVNEEYEYSWDEGMTP